MDAELLREVREVLGDLLAIPTISERFHNLSKGVGTKNPDVRAILAARALLAKLEAPKVNIIVTPSGMMPPGMQAVMIPPSGEMRDCVVLRNFLDALPTDPHAETLAQARARVLSDMEGRDG